MPSSPRVPWLQRMYRLMQLSEACLPGHCVSNEHVQASYADVYDCGGGPQMVEVLLPAPVHETSDAFLVGTLVGAIAAWKRAECQQKRSSSGTEGNGVREYWQRTGPPAMPRGREFSAKAEGARSL